MAASQRVKIRIFAIHLRIGGANDRQMGDILISKQPGAQTIMQISILESDDGKRVGRYRPPVLRHELVRAFVDPENPEGEGVGASVLCHAGVRLGPSLDGQAPPEHPS